MHKLPPSNDLCLVSFPFVLPLHAVQLDPTDAEQPNWVKCSFRTRPLELKIFLGSAQPARSSGTARTTRHAVTSPPSRSHSWGVMVLRLADRRS